MAQIVVRQIPDEVHRALKAQAAAHGRSAEAELREIIDLVDSGELRPVVGRELPFSEVPASLASAHNGGGHGKTVLVR